MLLERSGERIAERRHESHGHAAAVMFSSPSAEASAGGRRWKLPDGLDDHRHQSAPGHPRGHNDIDQLRHRGKRSTLRIREPSTSLVTVAPTTGDDQRYRRASGSGGTSCGTLVLQEQ